MSVFATPKALRLAEENDMGYIQGQDELAFGGSMKEPLLEEVEGKLGDMIKPGDKVFTFTSGSSSTRICSGIFRGVIRAGHGRNSWEHYVVERADGKRTKLHYAGMVPAGTTLEQLDDRYV
jgi:hypothetical protein